MRGLLGQASMTHSPRHDDEAKQDAQIKRMKRRKQPAIK